MPVTSNFTAEAECRWPKTCPDCGQTFQMRRTQRRCPECAAKRKAEFRERYNAMRRESRKGTANV